MELSKENNGWIKIESQDDLPKEDSYYYVVYKNGNVSNGPISLKILTDNNYIITHYQPIIKPKPPIY